MAPPDEIYSYVILNRTDKKVVPTHPIGTGGYGDFRLEERLGIKPPEIRTVHPTTRLYNAPATVNSGYGAAYQRMIHGVDNIPTPVVTTSYAPPEISHAHPTTRSYNAPATGTSGFGNAYQRMIHGVVNIPTPAVTTSYAPPNPTVASSSIWDHYGQQHMTQNMTQAMLNNGPTVEPLKVGDIVKIYDVVSPNPTVLKYYAGMITEITGKDAVLLRSDGTTVTKKYAHLERLDKGTNYKKKETETKIEIGTAFGKNFNLINKENLRAKGFIPKTALGTFTKGFARITGFRTNKNSMNRNATVRAQLLALRTANAIINSKSGGTRRSHKPKRRDTRRR